MKDINSILIELKRPFHPSKVNWKVQSAKKDQTAAQVVAFIDARDVSERLNLVCPGQWSNKHRELIIGTQLEGVICTLTVRDDNTSVTVEDIGIGPNLIDMADWERENAIKTYWSDSFKRAGVKLGIAESLYELDRIWLNQEDLYLKEGKIKGIEKHADKQLKDRYKTWVEKEAIKVRFGEVYE